MTQLWHRLYLCNTSNDLIYRSFPWWMILLFFLRTFFQKSKALRLFIYFEKCQRTVASFCLNNGSNNKPTIKIAEITVHLGLISYSPKSWSTYHIQLLLCHTFRHFMNHWWPSSNQKETAAVWCHWVRTTGGQLTWFMLLKVGSELILLMTLSVSLLSKRPQKLS